MKLAAIALSAVLAGALVPSVSAAAGEENPPGTAHPGYANLTELTGSVCTGAAEEYRNFFDSSPVQVRPFVHLAPVANASSLLGVMLADQIAAVLNDHANAVARTARGSEPQRLEGLLQEVDGYLRIHVLGTNNLGDRRSHVALVEMSAPLYRALHTYSGSW